MDIRNLINLPSVDNFIDSLSGKYPDRLPGDWVTAKDFTDAYAGTILSRQLTAVNPKIFEKKYPELAFMLCGIEADNIGGYAQVVQSLRLLELGGFTVSGDPSGNKGKVSLSAEDNYIKITGLETSATWTTTEIKQAELNNINLPGRYIEAINKVYQRGVDSIGLLGGIGLNGATEGLLNYSGFTATAAGALLSTLTAQQMYDAYASVITDQRNAVNNTPEYSAVRVITPVRCINILSKTIMNTANASNINVLNLLKQSFPDVEFFGSFRAEDNGSSTSATVAFSNSPDVMAMRIPIPLTIGEVIRVGSFDFKTDAMYRIGGLDVLESTGGRILTGL